MSNWNLWRSPNPNQSSESSESLDLKALLNQVTGGFDLDNSTHFGQFKGLKPNVEIGNNTIPYLNPDGAGQDNFGAINSPAEEDSLSKKQDKEVGKIGVRETGIIEKLCKSFGFILCHEKSTRLFFHYTQYKGQIDWVRLGEMVEFEYSMDRKTGRPIACNVTKLGLEVGLRDDIRMAGIVITGNQISYESHSECYFLTFGSNDVENGIQLVVGDTVSFLVVGDSSTRGKFTAKYVRLEIPVRPQKVKETVQIPIIEEEIRNEILQGRILKPIESTSNRQGLLCYRGLEKKGQPIELPYQTKDQINSFTLRHGDLVQFQLAINLSTKIQRATNVILTQMSSSLSTAGERREIGIIFAVDFNVGNGYISTINSYKNEKNKSHPKLFFRFCELMDFNGVNGACIEVGDVVEFTVIQDSNNGMSQQNVVRIKNMKFI